MKRQKERNTKIRAGEISKKVDKKEISKWHNYNKYSNNTHVTNNLNKLKKKREKQTCCLHRRHCLRG